MKVHPGTNLDEEDDAFFLSVMPLKLCPCPAVNLLLRDWPQHKTDNPHCAREVNFYNFYKEIKEKFNYSTSRLTVERANQLRHRDNC